ncbi:MAG: hypothetical protein H7282_05400 [Cytophagaceae bacterium]|nr:hypothetical protein [Cytophagaceae bacterium]
MKNSHFLLALVSAACLTFTGCKKNNEESPAPATTINDFFEKNDVPKQSFTVNLDHTNATISGEQGTVITFPKSAFVTKNGSPVTGDISVTVKEIYTKSDMILSDRATTSDGELLLSGGEIYIGAFSNGDTLRLASGTNILIELPASSVDTEMQLFAGSESNGQFNWMPVNTTSSSVPVTSTNWVNDSSATLYSSQSSYIFSTSKLGWINCDRFYSFPVKTKISLSYTNGGTIDNTAAYIVFKNLNSIARFYEHSTNGVFRSAQTPVGEDIMIVVISTKDGKQYFATKETTITEDLSLTLELTEASDESIKTALESLN